MRQKDIAFFETLEQMDLKNVRILTIPPLTLTSIKNKLKFV